MNIKIKEIVVIIISVAIMVGAFWYLYVNLLSKGGKVDTNGTVQSVPAVQVPSKFDDKTYGEVEKLKEYHKPSLDNIGNENPFEPLK